MIYAGFASVYDRLMQDVPYDQWINYLGRIFEKHSIKPVDILDIGCGTGNVTIPLADMGYNLTGLDMSAEMLAVAEEKARAKGLEIKWIQQDMCALDFGSTGFDMVISMTDSLNYITKPETLKEVFRNIKNVLKPGGWLIFDLNSAYKIKEIFSNNTYTLLDDDVAYIWDNEYDPISRTCSMELTFFVREKDGRYHRFSETHSETGYDLEEICELLNQSGYSVEAVYAENSFDSPISEVERIYYIAKLI